MTPSTKKKNQKETRAEGYLNTATGKTADCAMLTSPVEKSRKTMTAA